MRRRDFIKRIVGSAGAWPVAARAQQPERMRHIGVLMAFTENDPEAQCWTAEFREELGKLGWTEGHEIQIDIRWATADVESLQRFAKQLVALSKAHSVPACQLPKMGADGSVRAVFNAAFAYVVALPDRSQGRTKGRR